MVKANGFLLRAPGAMVGRVAFLPAFHSSTDPRGAGRSLITKNPMGDIMEDKVTPKKRDAKLVSSFMSRTPHQEVTFF